MPQEGYYFTSTTFLYKEPLTVRQQTVHYNITKGSVTLFKSIRPEHLFVLVHCQRFLFKSRING